MPRCVSPHEAERERERGRETSARTEVNVPLIASGAEREEERIRERAYDCAKSRRKMKKLRVSARAIKCQGSRTPRARLED